MAAVSCFAQAHTVAFWIGVQGRHDLVTCLFFSPLVFSLIASLLAGLPFVILTVRHSPFHRGFFCNDDSIKYPSKEDTISYQLLGGVMIPVTILTVSASVLLSANGSRFVFIFLLLHEMPILIHFFTLKFSLLS